MGSLIRVLACASAVLLVCLGCGGSRGPAGDLARDPRVASSQVGEIQQNIQLMLSFDLNMDGSVSLNEVDSGLKWQFEKADADHNGVLNLNEMQAENGRRWQASGTASSPLIDWNQDGTVSFAEFSGTAHSVFAQLDRDQGGALAGVELQTPRPRGAPPAAARNRGPGGESGPERPSGLR